MRTLTVYRGVEDRLQDVISALHLGWPGAHITHAASGRECLEQLKESLPDLIVVVVDQRGAEWLTLIRQVRQASAGVIIAVFREYDEGDLIETIEAGADDYVWAPINRSLFVARVRAALRRADNSARRDASGVECGELRVDLERHEARVNGHHLSLTANEFKLLLHMANRSGLVTRKELLCNVLWGENGEFYDSTLRKYIQRLRRKLGEVKGATTSIVTVPSVGYKLIAGEDALRPGLISQSR